MSEQQVKLQNWPFQKGEQAQLVWISSPLWHDKKIMIYVYFKANGKTEKVLADWGTLPALAIQHYYVDGDISKSTPPKGMDEVEVTIYPNNVSLYEREWQVQGTKDKDTSRSFIVTQGNRSYILPLIEVVRSILAPNRFLLYRLFEANSFPQYFNENYVINKIHLDFSSQYYRKYTQSDFLYQLVWLLTNHDLRNIFENVAYTFHQTGSLKFDWSLRQPITIKAIVKPNSNGGTVLRVVGVKNKRIPYSEISFTHPEVVQGEKSKEAKKYTLHTKNGAGNKQDEFILNEEIEGTTDNFDVIKMDKQKHEYLLLPKIIKVRPNTNKKRSFEDENTQRRFINDSSKRSTADTGGNQLARGLEQQPLMDIQIDGELGEFIKVMTVLQDFPEVQSINIIQGSFKEFSGTKRFVYLKDGVMERKYLIAEVKLFSGKEVSVIEVEREDKAISTLICITNIIECKKVAYNIVLSGLIKNGAVWDKEEIQFNGGIDYLTLRHGKNDVRHRAKLIQQKLNNF